MLYIIALIAAIFIAACLLAHANWRESRRRRYRPVVLVCRWNNRIGVVLLADFERAINRELAPFRRGTEEYDPRDERNLAGVRVSVAPTFELANREKYEQAVNGCHVFQGSFELPPRDLKPADQNEVRKYLFGDKKP